MSGAMARRLLMSSGKIKSPLEISGCALWLDASDVSTLFQDSALTTAAVADGDPVGGWKDKASGLSALQATSSKRPVLKLAQYNGNACLRLDGVDDQLDVGNAAAINVAQATLFVVGKYSGAGGYEVFVLKSVNSGWGSGGYALARNNTSGNFFFWLNVFSLDFVNVAVTSGVLALLEGRYGGTTIEAWSNGIPGTSLAYTAAVTNSSGSLNIGNGAGGSALNGDIAEIVLYNAALSETDRLKVQGYLNAKYGVY